MRGKKCRSHWDRYLGMTAAMTQVPVSTATRETEVSGFRFFFVSNTL